MRQELASLIETYEQHIYGQSMNLKLLLAAVLADGHVLIEGVPGTGKTQMVRTLSHLVDATFNRIQFTPDLLPSDMTGSAIYNMQEGTFQTVKGPIFANIILADEINRTPAKTQSALLEAMEEKQVTIQGETYPLPEVFFVAATQNPLEFAGTYPLPEAQQDRFLMQLVIDFPSFAEETKVLRQVMEAPQQQTATNPIMDITTFSTIRWEAANTTVHEDIFNYIMEIVRRTRNTDGIRFGASTRAAIAIAKLARSWAYLMDRGYVTPDDVKVVAKPALRHRLQLAPHMELEGVSLDEIIAELVGAVAVPR